jgi:hypothetical protein
MTRPGRWNLRGIGGQIAALVIVSILALHAIITASFFVNRPDQPGLIERGGHGRLATAVQLLGATPAADRPRLAADLARAFPELDIQTLPPVPRPQRSWQTAPYSTACIATSASPTASSHSQTNNGSASCCPMAR